MSASKILPNELSGPRSFFTDLDPRDASIDLKSVERNLKLQLLTKETIVIAASSLFHDDGLNFITQSDGLANALNDGILLPAIRDEFSNPYGFFEFKSEYSLDAKNFFTQNTAKYVLWNLEDNTSWFRREFYRSLQDPKSALRQVAILTDIECQEILDKCEQLLSSESNSNQHLSREIIKEAITDLPSHKQNPIIGYANLVYRISGARVVNSEGHFPQCNLTNIKNANKKHSLSDSSIFWDIFVEAVLQHITSASRINSERLDRLTFRDILTIRKELFETNFSTLYDELIQKSRMKVSEEDPEQIILRSEQLSEAAESLRNLFSKRIAYESELKDRKASENALWQVANIVSMFANPVIGGIVGTLSTLNSLPEITAPISKSLSSEIQLRSDLLRQLVNEKFGWSSSQKKTFINAYRSLLTYGI